MKFALVFPGQGSQSRGMLRSLAARFACVSSCFAEASAALGMDLWKLVSEGPDSQLNTTEFTQPAMLTAGVATWRAWCEQGGAAPTLVSGHSLGEFSALVCAEALPLAAAVCLVRERGQLMQRAVPEGQGAMAAILGMEDTQVEALCSEAAQGQVVEAVNFNSPGQLVIAGDATAVQRALELARARGAKRALLLPVSVPAHSSLMRQAAQQLQAHLAELPFAVPRYPFVSAVDAQRHSQPDDLRALLVRQLASPVRWTQTVLALLQQVGMIVECGPGKVLTGLNRRIDRNARCLAIDDPESLTAALVASQESAHA